MKGPHHWNNAADHNHRRKCNRWPQKPTKRWHFLKETFVSFETICSINMMIIVQSFQSWTDVASKQFCHYSCTGRLATGTQIKDTWQWYGHHQRMVLRMATGITNDGITGHHKRTVPRMGITRHHQRTVLRMVSQDTTKGQYWGWCHRTPLKDSTEDGVTGHHQRMVSQDIKGWYQSTLLLVWCSPLMW